MRKMRIFNVIVMCIIMLCPSMAWAQGYLNDATTSSAVLTRDPARQASTEIDAVVTNPAGTVFLPDGFHVSVGGIFSYGDIKSYKEDGKALARYTTETRVLPAIQAAFKKGNWAVSASFATEGGFGHREMGAGGVLTDAMNFYIDAMEFNKSFADLTTSINDLLSMGDAAANMRPEDKVQFLSRDNTVSLYNRAIRLGGSYRFNDKWSVYVGVKANYVATESGDGTYMAVVRPSTGEQWSYSDYFLKEIPNVENSMLPESEKSTLRNIVETAAENGCQVDGELNGYDNDSWGFAPIIGVDFKTGDFNFGAKYEFASHINAKDVRHFNVPANMSVGMNWQVSSRVKLAAGSNVVFASYNSINSDMDLSRAYDISVSGTYYFNNKWLASFGATYSHEQYVNVEQYYVPADAWHSARLAMGVAYSPIEKLQINFGVSPYITMMTVRTFNAEILEQGVEYNDVTSHEFYPKLQVALGVNYSF